MPEAIPSIYVSGSSCSGGNCLTFQRYSKDNITECQAEASGAYGAFLIGVGVLSIAVSILVIAHPISLGLVLFALMISVAFLITGIEMMALGISGRERIHNKKYLHVIHFRVVSLNLQV